MASKQYMELYRFRCDGSDVMIETTVMQYMHGLIFLKNRDSLHARLNSHYEAWSYKKKKHKNIRAHRKSV